MSYTPYAFNLNFFKNRLEFWTKNFRAISLNIKAHMRQVSSKSVMLTCWPLGHLSRNDPISNYKSNLLVQYFYYISWKFPITLCVGITFRNDLVLHFAYLVLLHFVKILYHIMCRYYISQQFFITLCVLVLHFATILYYVMRRYYISQRLLHYAF